MIAHVTRKTATALQEKYKVPNVSHPQSIPLHQSDFAGLHRKVPVTASPVSACAMRSSSLGLRLAKWSFARDDGFQKVAGALLNGELLHRPKIPAWVKQPIIVDVN